MQMMLTRRPFRWLAVMVATWTLGFTTVTTPVCAQPQIAARHGPVRLLHRMPPGHRTVHVGKSRYYVHGGAFYVRKPAGFIAVRAPLGAVVVVLPIGAMALLIGGVTFYVYQDVYYRRVPEGYVVVERPSDGAVARQASPVVPSRQTAGETVAVIATLLNVRSGPGRNFPVVHQIRRHDALVVHGYAPDWLYVKLPDGSFGWVMLKFTTAHESNAAG
ncbi:hypothetical protein DSCA_48880 [Desulfosarcina alkanivorans]|jgi:hypothetical protein|uniref:SH3b domain-containing protein n=1 Tax=Desulfosarcina alkanivorans TaxID=571177 RepID=A0A5K7YQF8_9BACT|nr:SH3 domain-containing protein [Desulfosarcina alkanivorans]BBO70958.1 hypothetical protein DSCA_48880 [Desulfosarcina alkanivorans]